MFEADAYAARRVLTKRGFAYELTPEGASEPALVWTLRPTWLADDLHLETPGGEPVLALTDESPSEYVDAPFTVVDERDGTVLGLLSRTFYSLHRRTWALLDLDGFPVATIDATSRLRSVARRRFLKLVPYRYELRDPDGERLGELHASVVPRRAFTLAFEDADPGGDGTTLDRRLAIAASAVVDGFELG